MKSTNKTQHSDIDPFDEDYLDRDAMAFLHTVDLWENPQFNDDVIDDFDEPLEFLSVLRRT